MKKKLLTVLLAILSPFATYASTLDFNAEVPSGVSLGGGMEWNATGSGHLFMQSWDNDDFIYFSSPTVVNSFQMNREPWEGYMAAPDDWIVSIAAFNSSDISLWSSSFDLTSYDTWDEWLTVDVDASDVSYLAFYATGAWTPLNYGFWPAIDNVVINEPLTNQVPEPVSVALIGLGLAGLGFSRRLKV